LSAEYIPAAGRNDRVSVGEWIIWRGADVMETYWTLLLVFRDLIGRNIYKPIHEGVPAKESWRGLSTIHGGLS
jgi:hypothetical protein